MTESRTLLLKNLRAGLKQGSSATIADRTGLDHEFVRNVLKGYVQFKSGVEIVISTAQDLLIEQRDEQSQLIERVTVLVKEVLG